MAISVVRVAEAVGTSTDTITVAAFNGVGCDCIFVGISSVTGIANPVSGVTFNSVGMTELWNAGLNAGVGLTAGFILKAPTQGSHDVVVTMTDTATAVWVGVVGLTGVDQTTPNRTAYTAIATSGNPTVTVVDSVSGDLVIDCCTGYDAVLVVDASQNLEIAEDGYGGTSRDGGISSETAVGANTVMSWTLGNYWGIGAVALIPASGGTSIVPLLLNQRRRRSG